LRINLEDDKIDSFLTSGKPKLLRLAVIVPKRSKLPVRPHISSVWYLWQGGHFWISTSEDRLKIRAIKKNPNVALVIDTESTPYKGVIVDGIAELTRNGVKEITLAIVKRYVKPKSVKTQYEDMMRYPRILIKIKPVGAIDIMSYKRR
jgi:nitroimidazol reductase NimA-like FMN-containing flavoprotein (pyridoxamine 5'-phosphate oxidase superfamily)